MERFEVEEFVSRSPLRAVFDAFPYAADFFSCVRIDAVDRGATLAEFLGGIPELYLDDFGLTRDELVEDFVGFIGTTEDGNRFDDPVRELTVIGGRDKSGSPEPCGFSVRSGEIVAIVGMTGSGKSRLLADIECLARRDTPTGRTVLVDGGEVDDVRRFDISGRLVAQLSQNMNFVMDVSARDFIAMHAESRAARNPDEIAREIFDCANELAGERFGADCTVTQLSGGQSRALMIADVALLSQSPVVLIDELENAGIDRCRAISLLAKKEKIVLMSTHDPLLALMADRRVVIRNGGIAAVVATSDAERENLAAIETADRKMMELRSIIRAGGRVDGDMNVFFSA
jgi:ABC-type lipoprotein export system ATPase subunit